MTRDLALCVVLFVALGCRSSDVGVEFVERFERVKAGDSRQQVFEDLAPLKFTGASETGGSKSERARASEREKLTQ